MAKAVEKKLPAKLSDVIRVGVADLIAVERLKKTYTVNMKVYHRPYDDLDDLNNKCSVCFAGAVMARTLEIDSSERIDHTEDFSTYNAVRLDALDILRGGEIDSALGYLNRPLPFGLKDTVEVVNYHDDPTLFKKQMRQIADLLSLFGE